MFRKDYKVYIGFGKSFILILRFSSVMTIRESKEQDYEQVAELYKTFFTEHNIFQKEKDEIVTYLKDQQDIFLVNEKEGKIVGAGVLVLQKEEGTHKRWKLRHFAFTDDNGKELLMEAEKRVHKSSTTAKIELTIAETEISLEFYKQNGYEQEGALTNHYRWGETCFLLGKSFS